MKKNFLFTSESVSEGHPDKVCDRISDLVVDTYLGAEPQSRVACETLTTTNKVVLAGEVRGPEIKKDDFDLILNISEDGWFGNSVGPYQHFSHSIFRSIEEGKSLIRSANNGISAFINSKGQIINQIKSTESGVIEVKSFNQTKKTLFSSFGNKIFFYFLLFYIILFFFLKKKENK